MLIAILVVLCGSVGWLRLARSKPSSCPACAVVSLVADRSGVEWVCAACDAEFFAVGTKLVRVQRTIPSAKLIRDKPPIPSAIVHERDRHD